MLRYWSAGVLMLLLLAGCGASDPGETAPQTPPQTTSDKQDGSGAPELEALREGGFVIFLRHADTDSEAEDEPGHTENLQDCTLQRNLSDSGRQQARMQGEAVQSLEIPVEEVLVSPYCRTLESAELTFGAVVEVVPELATVRYLPQDSAEREERLRLLGQLFSTPPPEGENTVVMTHELNLRLVSEITVPEGGAVVFEPGGESFEVFATLPPQWWGETLESSEGR